MATAVNPVFEFLKYAGSTQVKAHTRRTGSKVVSVKQHDREVEEAGSEVAARDAFDTLDDKKLR